MIKALSRIFGCQYYSRTKCRVMVRWYKLKNTKKTCIVVIANSMLRVEVVLNLQRGVNVKKRYLVQRPNCRTSYL